MRRPTRTRRLLIAAIASLLAFVVLVGAGVRSFWSWKKWNFEGGRAVGMANGCVFYSDGPGYGLTPSHESGSGTPRDIEDSLFTAKRSFLGMSIRHQTWISSPRSPNQTFKMFVLSVPLWFPLLLLLIIPIRWLIARPANAPAFPVIAHEA